jgi:enoyl-CoA hydratase/carnithine racemase
MPVQQRRDGAVAVITLDRPPVNALSHAMREQLWNALEAADADPAVHAMVLTGSGKGFCGGGDLGELRSPVQQAWPGISDHLLPRIEACRKPVIAALHGFAVGGGLELALACHFRVARRDTRLALPEIKHGVVPPSGSQRMPRAVGVERALEMIVFARYELAGDFEGTALFHRLCDQDPVGCAMGLASQLDPAAAPAPALLRHRPLARSEGVAAVAAWRRRLDTLPQASALMRSCVDAVEYAVLAPSFDDGLRAAKRLHDELANRAMRVAASVPQP